MPKQHHSATHIKRTHRTTELRCSILLLIAVAVSPSAYASAEDAVVLFDALCLSTDGKLPLIEKMVTAAGGQAIPQAQLNADQAIAEYGGKAFTLKRGDKKYAIAATSIGSCSIVARNISPQNIIHLLAANYPLAPSQKDSSGAQVITTWRVRSPSRFEGGLIMLNVPKSGFGADNMFTLGYIPHSINHRR